MKNKTRFFTKSIRNSDKNIGFHTSFRISQIVHVSKLFFALIVETKIVSDGR